MLHLRIALLMLAAVAISSCSTTGGTIGGLLPAPKFLKGEIKENTSAGSVYHRLRISLPQSIGPIIPGQFAMVSVEGAQEMLLPRPFSIHNFDNDGETSWLDFLFKVVGKGTALFSHLEFQLSGTTPGSFPYHAPSRSCKSSTSNVSRSSCR